ncbi:MAG: hypothetical protein ACN4GR_06995 [Arenicellales bacterium]
MNEEEILEAAIKRWGVEAQCMMAIEEASELIQALTHDWRGREANVIEEIADMSIMLDQLKRMYGEKSVAEVRAQKIARLQSRLLNADREIIC